MNTVTTSFSRTVRQTTNVSVTKMSQQKMTDISQRKENVPRRHTYTIKFTVSSQCLLV